MFLPCSGDDGILDALCGVFSVSSLISANRLHFSARPCWGPKPSSSISLPTDQIRDSKSLSPFCNSQEPSLRQTCNFDCFFISDSATRPAADCSGLLPLKPCDQFPCVLYPRTAACCWFFEWRLAAANPKIT
ncbi:hypothetical protein MRB53_002050 [Persea americana]|uniref:Uncharacterized protein n=1 Tax=Persea americana TaxID=3435 RepID=A0ACC2MTE4_PERAE|nr:hypothetical protein MRB53_002050 [Persea americana]